MSEEVRIKIGVDTETNELKKFNDTLDETTTTIKKQEKEWIHLSDGTKVFEDKLGRLREANGRYVASGERLNEALRKTGKEARATSKDIGSMAGVVGKLTLVGVGVYAGLQSIIAFSSTISDTVKTFMLTAMQFERYSAVLNTLEGSATRAEDSLNWISEFGAKTPYEISDVTESFIQLRSYGIEPTDGTLRALGDTASAMDKPIMQAVEAIADAVVGENERLKEFGIRASKIGDKIKYSWMNSSGEARTKIIENNSDIIKSTLVSIFNSKYEGAMEQQSKTLTGMLSNMSDNWTVYKKKVMEGGLYDYFKALVSVVSDRMSEAFENNANAGEVYANVIIEVINSTIRGFGHTYDALETVADYFNVLWHSGESAFWGIQVVSTTVASSILKSFEKSFNYIISKINSIIDMANSTKWFNFERIDMNLDMSDTISDLNSWEKKASKNLDKSAKSLENAYKDLATVSNVGVTFADKLVIDVKEKFAEFRENGADNSIAKEDFGDVPDGMTTETQEGFVNYEVESTLANVNDTVNELLGGIEINPTKLQEDLENTSNDLFDEDDGEFYTVVTNTTNALSNTVNNLDNLNNVSSTLPATLKNVGYALNTFGEEAKKSLQSNINTSIENLSSLRGIAENIKSSVYGNDEVDSTSYNISLENVKDKLEKLNANPFSASATKEYEQAVQELSSKVSNYLVPENFSSNEEYEFARASVVSDFEGFEEVADTTLVLLEAMKTSLSNAEFYLKTMDFNGVDAILSIDENGTVRAATLKDFTFTLGQEASSTLNGIGSKFDAWDWNEDKLNELMHNASFDWDKDINQDIKTILNKEHSFDWATKDYSTVKDKLNNYGINWDETTFNAVKGGLSNFMFDWSSSDYTKVSAGLDNYSFTWDENITQDIKTILNKEHNFNWATQDYFTVKNKLNNYGINWNENTFYTVRSGLSNFMFSWNKTEYDSISFGLDNYSFTWDKNITEDIKTILSKEHNFDWATADYDTVKDKLNDYGIDWDKTTYDSVKGGLSNFLFNWNKKEYSSVVSGLDNYDFNWNKTDFNGVAKGLKDYGFDWNNDGNFDAVKTYLKDGGYTITYTMNTEDVKDDLTLTFGSDGLLKDIKDATEGTKKALDGTTANATGDQLKHMTGNKKTSLENLKLKSETTKNLFTHHKFGQVIPQAQNIEKGGTGVHGSTGSYVTGSTTTYQYYADGGFTGTGHGQPDHTGFKQTGIVFHEGEWVAPKWMVDTAPSLFNYLEGARLNGFNQEDFLKPNNSTYIIDRNMYQPITVKVENSSTNDELVREIRELKKVNEFQGKELIRISELLDRVTFGGEFMNVKELK